MMNILIAVLVLATAQDPPPRRDPLQPPPAPRPPDAPQPPERRPAANPNIEEIREWLRVNEPETYRTLTLLQAEGRRPEVTRILNDAVPRMKELADLKQRDPRGYEKLMDLRRLERESMELGETARRAPPEQREAAVARLKESLAKLFDVREEVRARELAELKRRVEALEKAVNDRKASKDRIIEKRRRELMGEKSEDDW